VSIQRYVKAGRVRYRARVKHHGREVATQVFDRKNDAVVWEAEQKRRLRLGEWIDPKRGRVPLRLVADDWFESRHSVKRKTREADRAAWKSHIEARFGDAPVASITPAEIAHWVGGLVSGGISPSTASRYLATLRSILAYAVADGRVSQTPRRRSGLRPPATSAAKGSSSRARSSTSSPSPAAVCMPTW
jgi:integrase